MALPQNITSNDPSHDKTSDLQTSQDVKPNTIHTQTNTQSMHMYKAQSTQDNITCLVTTFEQTKTDHNGHICVVTFPHTMQPNPTSFKPQWVVQV